MNRSQLAVQMYTLRDCCGDQAQLARVAAQVRAIGYEAVELVGLPEIPDREIARILEGEGLAVCSSHESPARLFDRPEESVGRLQLFGCRLAACPHPHSTAFESESELDRFVGRLRRAAAVFREAGLTLGYHHHALEFRRYGPGTVFEEILRRTEAEGLAAELDTYWVQLGGGDPSDWCRRLRGRMPFIHLKDLGIGENQAPITCEVGSGNLAFAKIVMEAERSGCQWYIVEQDHCRGNPLDALRTSYEYLITKVCD